MSLLDEIEIRIAAYGGAERVVDAIEREWVKSPKQKAFNPFSYTKDEVQIIKESVSYLSRLTGRSERSIASKIKRLYF